jgi:hypothetical protein
MAGPGWVLRRPLGWTDHGEDIAITEAPLTLGRGLFGLEGKKISRKHCTVSLVSPP